MQVRLEVTHRNANHKRVVLKSDTLIGRSTDCNLRIASKEVSRKHCQIKVSDSAVTVRDLGSANGTFVNGYKLDADTDYAVAPDSELSVGGIKFVVRYEMPAAATPGSTVDLHTAAEPSQPTTVKAGAVPAVVAESPPEETVLDEGHAAVSDSPSEDEADFEPLTAEADAGDETDRFTPDAPDTAFEDAAALDLGTEPPTVSEADEVAKVEYVPEPGEAAPDSEEPTADDLQSEAEAAEVAADEEGEWNFGLEPEEEDDLALAFADVDLAETQDFPVIAADEDALPTEDEDDDLGDFLKGLE